MTTDKEKTLEFVGLTSRPAVRALEAAGYTRLEDLTQVTEKELLALHGMGPKAIRMLNAELAKRGQAIGSALASITE
jgi:DNA-directed RNA polymerase alpha subunit